jgi:hypothetical protein
MGHASSSGGVGGVRGDVHLPDPFGNSESMSASCSVPPLVLSTQTASTLGKAEGPSYSGDRWLPRSPENPSFVEQPFWSVALTNTEAKHKGLATRSHTPRLLSPGWRGGVAVTVSISVWEPGCIRPRHGSAMSPGRFPLCALPPACPPVSPASPTRLPS